MRRLRERHGGLSIADRTRNEAIRELVARHRTEYEDILQQVRAADAGS